MTKQQIQNELLRVIEHAKQNGFQIVVASDPEGNNWHTINPQDMFYGNENEEYIAIGVWEYKNEDDIFNN